jgi:hypothetical protein
MYATSVIFENCPRKRIAQRRKFAQSGPQGDDVVTSTGQYSPHRDASAKPLLPTFAAEKEAHAVADLDFHPLAQHHPAPADSGWQPQLFLEDCVQVPILPKVANICNNKYLLLAILHF